MTRRLLVNTSWRVSCTLRRIGRYPASSGDLPTLGINTLTRDGTTFPDSRMSRNVFNGAFGCCARYALIAGSVSKTFPSYGLFTRSIRSEITTESTTSAPNVLRVPIARSMTALTF